MVQLSHTAPIDAGALTGLDRDVYTIGDVLPPAEILTSQSVYIDHVPRPFMPAEMKVCRAEAGAEASITLQIRLGAGPATLFTNPVVLSGEVTTVPFSSFTTEVQADGIAEDTRLTAILAVTPGIYGSETSKGLRISTQGKWTA